MTTKETILLKNKSKIDRCFIVLSKHIQGRGNAV